jgi:hypothetical protein
MVGTPILLAEEVGNFPDEDLQEWDDELEHIDSRTWTFYKLRTIEGSMTIRWLGESNGYYGEVPEFDEIGVDNAS